MKKPPLALEAYATLSAEIDAGHSVEGVIAREEISAEVWASAGAFWQARFAEEAERKKPESQRRYQTIYHTKLRIFAKKKGASEDAEETVRPARVEAGAIPIDALVPAIELPSFMIRRGKLQPSEQGGKVSAGSFIAEEEEDEEAPPTTILNQEPTTPPSSRFQEGPTVSARPGPPVAALPFAEPAQRSEERSRAATGPALSSSTTGPHRSPSQKRLTLNQFASLTAEIAANPGDAASTRGRYGVTATAHRDEEARWTADFAKDGALKGIYLATFQRYFEYLKRGG